MDFKLESFLELFGVVFGGLALKVLDRILSRRQEQQREEERERTDFRAEITELRKQRDEAEAKSDFWRGKFWEEIEKSEPSSHSPHSLFPSGSTLP